MSEGHSAHTTSGHHTTETHHKTGIDHAAATEHKVAKAAHRADSMVYEAQVLASGNPKRIERYFFRKIACKLFGRFMAKTVNRI